MADDFKVRVNDPARKAYEEPLDEFTTIDFGDTTRNVGNGVGSVVGQVGRIYLNIITLPLNLLPAKSRFHAKRSLREGFLTVKVLVDDITNGIDHTLSRSLDRDQVRAASDEPIPPARGAL